MPVIEIELSRGDPTGRACLEYSYIPQGLRRTLWLNPGIPMDRRPDSLPPGLHPTHVHIHTLDNHQQTSTATWQLPPGPAHPSPIADVSVHLDLVRAVAIATLVYTDGHKVTDERALDPFGRECPDRRKLES